MCVSILNFVVNRKNAKSADSRTLPGQMYRKVQDCKHLERPNLPESATLQAPGNLDTDEFPRDCTDLSAALGHG